MFTDIVYFKLLGLSVLWWFGIVALVLLLIAPLFVMFRTRKSLRAHKIFAAIGLVFALAHGLAALYIKFFY